MTINVEEVAVQYIGDGSTTVFSYPFRLDEEDWLFVFLEGFPVSSLDYSIDLVLREVEFVSAPDIGVRISIIRSVPANQNIDYTPYDSFPAETHEFGLDKLTMLVQQAFASNNLAITVPRSELGLADLIAPPIAFRKNQVLAFDEFGNVTVVAGPGGTSSTLVDIQPGLNGFIDARDLLLVDNATFGARLPLIGIPGINAPGRLMQLNKEGSVSPDAPGGIPFDILAQTPSILFAVLSDDGTFGLPYDPDYITDDLIKFTRQEGVGVPFAEVMQVQNINGIKRLVATDANGQIPAELLSFQGLRNLGSWRGDNLCPKYFDGADPGGDLCVVPDYRNPSDVLPGSAFLNGDFFAVTIA